MRGAGPAAVPSVNVGGVVNNASYTLASRNIAPSTIVAVFGTDLTDGSSCLPAAGCFPSFDSAGRLGTTMSGAQVIVNGIPVPIFYAAPTQLGVQIPTDLPGTSASIRVTVGGQTSESRTISLDPFSPGIFTVSQDGKGAGAITHSDGSLVEASNPARPGEVIIIYATGLGQVTPAVPTGTLPRGTTTTLTTPTVTIDGIPAQVQFSGLSGCCVGLNQINAVVPINVHLANNISVVLSIGGRQSNVVTLATAATTPLTATPGSINFGDVLVGTSSTRTVTLTNTGIVSLTISQANVSGPGLTVSGLSLPLALDAGQSTSFSVTFLPTVPGSVAGSISITSDALNSFLVPLAGNATSTASQPTITTNSLPDGVTTVAYSATLVATGGKQPYSWSVIAGTLPTGLVLAASSGVISGVPTADGTFNFTVQVTEANSQTATKALSITVSSTPPSSVSLTWTASTSVLAGYNVYRGNVSGGPFTKLNSTLITGTAYDDITILRGQTYIYVATAVDSLGVESQFSNEATAVVP